MTRNTLATVPATGTPLMLLRLPEVRRRTGKCRSDIYRGISCGTFPAPVKLGKRASAWDSREIDRWVLARIAERDAKVAA